MTDINVKILENGKGLDLPKYETEQSAGLDLYAAIDSDITLKPMERILVPTGLAIALKPGFEAQIRPRSGLAYKHGITVLNAPGTIDADYRGEVKALIVNLGTENFTIERGLRIAQMVIAKYEQISWNAVEDLDETSRDDGGFGSTGLKSA